MAPLKRAPCPSPSRQDGKRSRRSATRSGRAPARRHQVVHPRTRDSETSLQSRDVVHLSMDPSGMQCGVVRGARRGINLGRADGCRAPAPVSAAAFGPPAVVHRAWGSFPKRTGGRTGLFRSPVRTRQAPQDRGRGAERRDVQPRRLKLMPRADESHPFSLAATQAFCTALCCRGPARSAD